MPAGAVSSRRKISMKRAEKFRVRPGRSLELSKHYNPDLPHPNIMTEELNPISKAEDMWPVIISGSEKKPPYLF